MTNTINKFDTVAFIVAFETGDVTTEQVLNGFAELIRTCKVWYLQGSYGRTAESLINQGLITAEGELTDRAQELIDEEGDNNY